MDTIKLNSNFGKGEELLITTTRLEEGKYQMVLTPWKIPNLWISNDMLVRTSDKTIKATGVRVNLTSGSDNFVINEITKNEMQGIMIPSLTGIESIWSNVLMVTQANLVFTNSGRITEDEFGSWIVDLEFSLSEDPELTPIRGGVSFHHDATVSFRKVD